MVNKKNGAEDLDTQHRETEKPGSEETSDTVDQERNSEDKPEEEDSQRSRIEELLDEGYTPQQIERQWGFPYSTVKRIAKKRITPEGVIKQDGSGGMHMLPTVLKAGGGHEVISPESILQSYLLSDGDAGALMLKGMMVLRAAQMMVLTDVEIMKGQADAQARAIKPILEIMEQSRRDMDAAAQRAKDSNVEVATRAAAEVGGRAMDWMEEKWSQMQLQKPDIAQAPDPMKGLMARTMEMLMNHVTGMMFGGGAGTTPGLVDKRGPGGQGQ